MINTDTRRALFLIKETELAPIAKKTATEAFDVYKANYPDSGALLYLEKIAKHLGKAKNKNDFTIDYFHKVIERVIKESTSEFSTEETHDWLVGLPTSHQGGYRYRHKAALKTFCQIWMMLLRAERALVLPYDFPLPYKLSRAGGVSKRTEIIGDRRGELLDFIVSIYKTDEPLDAAFEFLKPSSFHMFISYCTGYVIALGWITPEDVNLDEIFKLREAFNALPKAYKPKSFWNYFIQAIVNKFSSRLPFSGEDFNAMVKGLLKQKSITNGTSGLKLIQQAHSSRSHASESKQRKISQIKNKTPTTEFPYVKAQPFSMDAFFENKGFGKEINCDFNTAKVWLDVEQTYFSKIKLETPDGNKTTIAFLNAYLFGYLHDWHKQRSKGHDRTKLIFPSSPSLTKRSVHISKLVTQSEFELPMTLMEFFERLNEYHEWSANTYYSKIKHLEKFFQFIEDYESELPGCDGFKQPLSKLDFPRSERSLGTNKGLIPRQVFGFLVSYVECLAQYNETILDVALARSGGLTGLPIEKLHKSTRHVLTQAAEMAHDFGSAPSFEWKGKTIIINELPNFFDLGLFLTASLDGEEMKLLPRNHILRHISTALQTGIRGNHIQWLDASIFDQYALADEPFTRLWVNTDKFKKSGWTPYVNQSVIEGLRRQRLWRDSIAEPGFKREIPYNGNDKSKWGKFLPLFSFSKAGLPYDDSTYVRTWKETLFRVQIEMRKNGFECPELVRLLPATIANDEPDLLNKLCSLSEGADVVELQLSTHITPHSARVSLVSHLISALPAEFIGKHITGQSPAVVAYYTKLDPDYLHRQEQIQGMEADRIAHVKTFNDLMADAPQDQFIHADGPASKLAESLRRHYGNAVNAFGCMSMSNDSDGKTGLDLLADSIGRNAVFNKTEICPHGNHCPPEIVKELKARGRCGICPRAVRSIDHLPAIAAKCRQMNEEMMALDDHIEGHAKELTENEIEALEAQRQMLAEEIVGWIVALEVLDATRVKALANNTEASWVAGKPEIIQQSLMRVQVPTEETQYVLARLSEAQAYPALQGPEIKAKFDLLRRQIAARMGYLKVAFDLAAPKNPSQACAGFIRSFVQAHKLSYDDVTKLLSTNDHLALPTPTLGLLPNLGADHG